MNFYADIFKKVNQRVRDIKLSVNPLFIWITCLWCASKVLQWSLRSNQTIWEISWNWFLDKYGNNYRTLFVLIFCFNQVCVVLGDDKYNLIVYGTGTFSIALIIFVSGLFLFMDVFLWPQSLRKYKVQLHTNEPADIRRIIKVNLMS
jgi:hypothetical protein